MIADTSEFISLPTFSDEGVKTTDTFNIWRKKTNGLVQLIGLLQENSLTNPANSIEFDFTNATLRIKTDGVKEINIDASAVTRDKIANLAVTNSKLAGGITNDKIANLAVTNSKLAGGITNDKLAGSITGSKLADLTITNVKIAEGTIANSKLAGGITNDKLAGGITNDKLAGNITGSKLADLTITNGKIAEGTIANSKFAGGITNDKLANETITDLKIASNAVVTRILTNGSVTASKLSGMQTGLAPIYGARAFVRFQSTPSNDVASKIQNAYLTPLNFVRTLTDTVITVPFGHTFKPNHIVSCVRLTGGVFSNGNYVISSVTDTTITIPHTGSVSNGTLRIELIPLPSTGLGNVASICYIDQVYYRFAINFIEPMPSDNYAFIALGTRVAGGSMALTEIQNYPRTSAAVCFQNYYPTSHISISVFA